MQEQHTLERGFGARVGGFFQELLEAHGVTRPRRATSSSASRATSACRKVVTRAGLELDADAVVIGAGVTPDVQLAAARGP